MGHTILLAPDSFKGSLSAAEVAAAMAVGAARAIPHATVITIPLADGGEGTVDALVHARGGSLVTAPVTDPLGRPITAQFGKLSATVAVAEMASASGLPLLAPHERDPFRASSFGTGELLRAALDADVTEIILGVGGSATVDGGAGALQALGVQLLDSQERQIAPGNAGLASLRRIDFSTVDARLRRTRLRIACDVRNPLIGPNGAAAVFGPQKGAAADAIPQLDANLAHFARVLQRDAGLAVAAMEGAGAAGGLVAGLTALGAHVEPGIDLVLAAVSFRDILPSADLVLTGEGKLDGQTAQGKVISGVVREARVAGVPVVALAGMVDSSALEGLYASGLLAGFSVLPAPMRPEQAFAETAANIAHCSEALLRLWHAAWQQGARESRVGA